jgi:hypothetical protein
MLFMSVHYLTIHTKEHLLVLLHEDMLNITQFIYFSKILLH